MARLAPSGAITLATVVVHSYRCPRRGTGVASHAGHGNASQQLIFRNVVGRFAGGFAVVVTTGAVGGDRERAVVGLGTQKGGSGFVTGLAARCRRNMVAVLAGCDVGVMASQAPRHNRDVGVELGWRPTAVALVAAGAVERGRNVVSVLAGGAAAVVAA